jgi:protein-disulfide isomerase
MQGKYLAFHDALYASHGPINETSTLDIAAKVGLDLERLTKDMADPAIDDAIKKNIVLVETLLISGTPKGITPGLVGLEVLKQMMANARKE